MGVAYLPPYGAPSSSSRTRLWDCSGIGAGAITVHAPVSLAALWLAPKLPSFIGAHPSIDVRLSSVIWTIPARTNRPTWKSDMATGIGAAIGPSG